MIDPIAGFASMPVAAPAPARNAVEAGKQFEALFVKQILAQMPLAGTGKEGEKWIGMFRDQLAAEIVEGGGFGLADVIARDIGTAGTPAALPPPRPAPVASPSTARVTSGFGTRIDPFDGSHRRHAGIDVGAPEGTPIRAAFGGVVQFAGRREGYGNLVVVDHGDGLETRYAHCSRLDVVAGQRIAEGEAVAAVGETGRATGPHLHFEVRRDGIAIDPKNVIEEPQVLVEASRQGRRGAVKGTEGTP